MNAPEWVYRFLAVLLYVSAAVLAVAAVFFTLDGNWLGIVYGVVAALDVYAAAPFHRKARP